MKLPQFRFEWMRHWPAVNADRASIRTHFANGDVQIPATYGPLAADAAFRALDALLDLPSTRSTDAIVFNNGARMVVARGPLVDDTRLRRLRDVSLDLIARHHPTQATIVRQARRVADDPRTLELFFNAALAASPERALGVGITATVAALWRDLNPGARPWLLAQALEIELPADLETALDATTAQQLGRDQGLVIGSDADGVVDLRAPLHALSRCRTWPDTDPRQVWRTARAGLGAEAQALFDVVLADHTVGLGLAPPPAQTPHADLLEQMVALASEAVGHERIFVLHGRPGSGRSALGRALAHRLKGNMEPIWLSFERGALYGWTEVAWATDDVLPGGNWVGPPPWLDLLFEVLAEAPRLYLIEEADAEPAAELAGWLPSHGIICLVSERRLRALDRPDTTRFKLADRPVESDVRWPVTALAHFGSLPRETLCQQHPSIVGEAEQIGHVIAQPSGRLRYVGPPVRGTEDNAQMVALAKLMVEREQWPPTETDVLATTAILAAVLHADSTDKAAIALALKLLEQAVRHPWLWLPRRQAALRLLSLAELLADADLSAKRNKQLQWAEDRLLHGVDDSSGKNLARNAAFDARFPAVLAKLDGKKTESQMPEPLAVPRETDFAAIETFLVRVVKEDAVAQFQTAIRLCRMICARYPSSTGPLTQLMKLQLKTGQTVNPQTADRVARAAPDQVLFLALRDGMKVDDDALRAWAHLAIRQTVDAPHRNSTDRLFSAVCLLMVGERLPTLASDLAAHALLLIKRVHWLPNELAAELEAAAIRLLRQRRKT